MKKKVTIIIGVIMIAALAAVPVLAQGPGSGRGWGFGPGNCPGYGYGAGAAGIDQEKAKAVYEARQQFFNQTSELRNQLQVKRLELRALMVNPQATKDQALAKQKEVLQLRGQLASKGLAFNKDLQTKYPELAGSGFGGRGWGRGQGRGGYGACGGPGGGYGRGMWQ